MLAPGNRKSPRGGLRGRRGLTEPFVVNVIPQGGARIKVPNVKVLNPGLQEKAKPWVTVPINSTHAQIGGGLSFIRRHRAHCLCVVSDTFTRMLFGGQHCVLDLLTTTPVDLGMRTRNGQVTFNELLRCVSMSGMMFAPPGTGPQLTLTEIKPPKEVANKELLFCMELPRRTAKSSRSVVDATLMIKDLGKPTVSVSAQQVFNDTPIPADQVIVLTR